MARSTWAMEIQDLVATNIRRLREKAGISQEELAARARLDRTYISGIERSKRNPTVKVLSQVADAIGVPITSFFAEENSPGNVTRQRRARSAASYDDHASISGAYQFLRDIELLTTADVAKLAAIASAGPDARRSEAETTDLLNAPFYSSVFDAAMDITQVKTDRLSQWCDNIEDCTASVLEGFGYNPRSLPSNKRALALANTLKSRKHIQFLDQVQRVSERFNVFVAKERTSSADKSTGAPISAELQEKLDLIEYLSSHHRVTIFDIEKIPETLSTIKVLCSVIRDSTPERRQNISPSAYYMEALYYGLMSTYCLLYEEAPATTDGARGPDARGTRWVRLVIRLAAGRLAFYLDSLPNDAEQSTNPWLKVIRDALEKADQQTAGHQAARIRQAWKKYYEFHRRRFGEL